MAADGSGGDAESAALDIDAWIKVMADLLDLPMPEDYRAGVAANLRTASAMAGLLAAVPLPDEVEAAPVFRA